VVFSWEHGIWVAEAYHGEAIRTHANGCECNLSTESSLFAPLLATTEMSKSTHCDMSSTYV
jgi:hypothetical protein